MTQSKALIGVNGIRSEFSLGRDLATRLAELLPHVTAGRVGTGVKRLVHRGDLERVIACATAEKADLWELVRRPDAREVLQAWLALKEAN